MTAAQTPKRKIPLHQPGGRQRGFSFIEVLVAVLILSIGLLGLASLQIAGVQANHSAYLRSQATLFSYEIVDAMRANREAAINGQYNKDFGDGPPGSSDSIVDLDMNDWVNNVREQLPQGEARIDVDSDNRVRVVVRWLDERRGEQDEFGTFDVEEAEREFEYATEL